MTTSTFTISAFESGMESAIGQKFKLNFESGVVFATKANISSIAIACLAMTAVIFGILILNSSPSSLSFLNNVDPKWAWTLIGIGSCIQLPIALRGAYLTYKHYFFRKEAESKFATFSVMVAGFCSGVFSKIRIRGLNEQQASNKWTRYDLYDSNWQTGEKINMYLYVRDNTNVITIVSPQYEEQFSHSLGRKNYIDQF